MDRLRGASIIGGVLIAIAIAIYPADILGIWLNVGSAILQPIFIALLGIGSFIIAFAQFVYPFLANRGSNLSLKLLCKT